MRILFCLAPVLFVPILLAQDLHGVIDVHIHCDPDVIPRSVDALEVTRLAKERGLRGLVLKNHYEPTASWAFFARKQHPGIEVFGGIALNLPVGGVNPAAVERMARLKGGWGRIVWMPTFDAENQVRYSNESRPYVSVSRNGRLLPEVIEVLELIGKHGLVLATGHSSPEESLLLIREARRHGVERIIVTHAMLAPIRMNIGQMIEAAKEGAFIEFVYNGLIGTNKQFTIEQYADAIRRIGPERCIVASDLGQEGNPLPADGLGAFQEGLKKQGFTTAHIKRMATDNPSWLLGLR